MPHSFRRYPALLAMGLSALGCISADTSVAQQVKQSSYYRNASRSVEQQLTGGTPALQAQLAGGRSAISVAVGDFYRDGVTALVTGYSVGGGGALTVQRGNLAAVAPKGSDFAAFQQGVIAPAFLPAATTFALPVRPDFLLAADVNGDGPTDLLVAAKGDTSAWLLTGRGSGNFNAPQVIALNGTLSALTTWRQSNGSSLVLAGVCGTSGCSLQAIDSTGVVKYVIALPGAVTAMDKAPLNGGNLEDLAVVAGGNVLLIDGDSVATGTPHVDSLPVSQALTLAAGNYVFDARGLQQLAVLDGGGNLHVLARQGLDSHQPTPDEIRAQHPWGRGGWPAGTTAPVTPRLTGTAWSEVEVLPNVGPGNGTVPLMVRGHLTVNGTDDLAVLSGSQVTQVAHGSVLTGSARLAAPVITQDSSSTPVLGAALARISPDARYGLITADGSASPKVAVPETGGITFYVNTTADANDTLTTANRCTNNVPSTTLQCTLRDAINLSTKSPTGPNTINVPAGTYTISQQNTFADNLPSTANYHMDIDSNVSIVGAGSATTIINANSLDKVFSLNSGNNYGTSTSFFTYTIALTGMTLENGNNVNGTTGNCFGGNMDWEAHDGSLTLTDVTLNNGYVQHGDGGGVHGDDYYGTGTTSTLTITNSTISNNTAVNAGGGISYPDNMVLKLSGSTVSGNKQTDASVGGGGLNTQYPYSSTQSTISNSTISGNSSNEDGGGILENNGVAISGTTFSNNTAVRWGGGIYFFSQLTAGSVVDSTFTGNGVTDTSGGSGPPDGGAVFVTSAANPALNALSISYSRLHGNTVGTGDAHTGVGIGEGTGSGFGGQVTATDNWWGCNPTTSSTSIAGTNCDTAGIDAGTSTFSGNPYTLLKLTLSTTTPTGAASFSATGSMAQDSSGNAYSGSEDTVLSGLPAKLVITQPDTTATTDNGSLSATDAITESATPDTGVVDYGSGTASVTVDGFTVSTGFTLDESDLKVVSTHTGNFYTASTGDIYTLTVSNIGNSVTSGTVTVIDTLPSGFTATAMGGTNWNCTLGTLTCTTTVTEAGTTSFPAITLTVSLNATDVGTYTNTVSVGGGGELDGNNNTATDTTLVVGPPTLITSFSPTSIALNGTSTETFTLGNASINGVTLTGLAFSDTLPSGLKVATPSSASTTCTSGSVTAVAASGSISLSGASLNAASTCTVTVNVTSAAASVYTNTTGALTAANGPSGSAASASLTVLSPPSTTMTFGASTIAYGGTTSLTYTITNNNSGAGLSGIAFTNNLPSGLVVSTPSVLTGSCNGGVAASPGATSVVLSNGTLAASSQCQIVINVTGTSAGVKNNSVTVSATTAGAGSPATASVTVSPAVAVALKVTGLGPFTVPAAAGTATVTAQDALGGTVTTYTGTVHFTSTDADATLPGDYTFGAGDLGVHNFAVKLNTAGTWSVTATDTGNSSITGSQTGIVVGDAIWILNGNMQLERLTEAGVQANQTSVTGTVSTLGSIAFDNLGDAWVVGNSDSKVYEYSATAGTLSSGVTSGGLNTPTGVAIDGLGNAWIANGNNTVSEIANGAVAVSPSTGYLNGSGTLNSPTGILVDTAGSVWVINSGNNTVTKIIGAAAPVTTPTITGTTNNTLGVRP